METTQNKHLVTNRFGDRDFILDVCTCFIYKCGRFEVIGDFCSLKNGGIPFWSMEASHIESDVTIQFLAGGFVIHFAGIFHVASSVQKLFENFMCVQWLTFFFQFLGANMTPKMFFANMETLKRHFLEKICVD
jgi:hypothetical protein